MISDDQCDHSRDGLVCIHGRGHGVPDGENVGRHYLVYPDDTDQDPDLPALLAAARRTFPPANCRLGPTEHDGSRFCHEHVGRVRPESPTSWQCDVSATLPSTSEGES